MAIKYLAGNKLTGLSGDTKPTNVPVDSEFYETNTKLTFRWTGSAWEASGIGGTVEGSEIAVSTIPLNRLANGTANKTIGYDENGAIAELASSSGVAASSAVMAYDTVGKYGNYKPILGAHTDYRKRHGKATYWSDFSDSTMTSGWSHTGDGAYASGGALHTQADDSTSTYDLWTLLGNNKVDVRNWCLRFTFKPKLASRTQGDCGFGLSSKDNSVDLNESQNWVGFIYRADSTEGSWHWGSCYGSQNPRDSARDDNMGTSEINYSQSNNAWAHKTRVYIEIIREGNRFIFRRYTDNDFRECVDEYEQSSEAKSYFTDPNESEDGNSTTQNDQRLRYLKISGSNGTTGGQGMMDCTVDYVQFWNGSCGIGSAPYYLTRRAWERDTNGTKPSGELIGGREHTHGTIFRNFPVTGTENVANDHKCIGNESSNFWDAVGVKIDSQDHPISCNRWNGERQSEQAWVRYNGYPLRSVSFWLWKEGLPTGRLRLVVYGQSSASHFRARSSNWIDASTISATAGKANATKCEFFIDGYLPRYDDHFMVEIEGPTKTDEADGYTIPDPHYRGQSHASTARVHICCRNDPNNEVDDNYSGQYCRFAYAYGRQSSSQSGGVPNFNRLGSTIDSHYWYDQGSVQSDDNWTPYVEWKWGAEGYVSPPEENTYIDCFVGEDQWKYEQYGNGLSNYDEWQNELTSADPLTFTWSTTQHSNGWETGNSTNHGYFYDNDSDSLTSNTENYSQRRMNMEDREHDQYRHCDFASYKHRTIIVRINYHHGSIMFFGRGTDQDQFELNDKGNRGTTPDTGIPYIRDRYNEWKELCYDENYNGSWDHRVIVVSGYWRYLRMYMRSRENDYQSQYSFYWYANYPRKIVSHIDITPLKKLYTHNASTANATTDIMTATQLEIQKQNDDQSSTSEYPTYTTVRTINVSALTDGQSNYIRVPVADTTCYRIRVKDSGNKVLALSQVRVKYHNSNDISFNHGHQPMTATDASLQLSGEA